LDRKKKPASIKRKIRGEFTRPGGGENGATRKKWESRNQTQKKAGEKHDT